MVWYCIGVYIINRTLHGSLEVLNSSPRIEKIFQKSKRNFVSPRGHVISSSFFFLPMEYRIMLAIDRCTTLTFRFLVASWRKIHLHVVEFSPVFMVCRNLKSPRFVLYLHIRVKLDLFRYPALDQKSPP